MGLIRLLFGFEGRVNRGRFWLAVMSWIVFFLVVVGLVSATGSLNAAFTASLLAYLPILVSAIAVGIKRLHDRNKSSWWLLVFYGAPFVLPFVVLPFLSAESQSSDALPGSLVAVQYVSLAIMVWALVELGLIRGTIGANPYGPDPVAPKPAPARMAH